MEEVSEQERGKRKRCRLLRKQTEEQADRLCEKERRSALLKRVAAILHKTKEQRTPQEEQTLRQCSSTVHQIQSRWRKREAAKRRQYGRQQEIEEPPEDLTEKCRMLAQAIAQSQHLVVYTGAGISTAAQIPDYRGPNGIWTRLQQGKDIGNHNLTEAEPTYTHMALSQLYHQNILKYVVSQNCDGLHLRSGLPRSALSELHGNMYVEVCKGCKPVREYWRCFDVTENTARYSHKTMRKCYICNAPLMDTIVHFGERGSLQWPLNWKGACQNAQKATTILCLGSSLKVLKKYPWLWQMDKPQKQRPNLYIVNLQWTPKDDCANAKIHGRCDTVMEMVMNLLGINVPSYNRSRDPLFNHFSDLCKEEFHTTTQPMLTVGGLNEIKSEVNECRCGENECLPVKNENIKAEAKTDYSQMAPFDCDIFCNSISKSDSTNYRNDANITDIKQETQYVELFPHNFLAYYQIMNSILLQNPLLTYQDMYFYPYQSGLLYSGFHSIIDQLPTGNTIEEDAKSELNRNDAEVRLKQTSSQCKFCNREYKSIMCLFYSKVEPVFQHPQFRVSKSSSAKKMLHCLCCDYSTEEEDEEEEKKDEYGGSTDPERPKVQAGWFGKGYRKSRRNRKR